MAWAISTRPRVVRSSSSATRRSYVAWVSLVVSIWLAEALVTACPPKGGYAGGAVRRRALRLIGPGWAGGRPEHPWLTRRPGCERMLGYVPPRAPRRHYSL